MLLGLAGKAPHSNCAFFTSVGEKLLLQRSSAFIIAQAHQTRNLVCLRGANKPAHHQKSSIFASAVRSHKLTNHISALQGFNFTQLLKMSSESQCRQNFHEECEAGVNRQINLELTASYVYDSLAFYCHRDDVALPNLHKFFRKSSEEEREHAEKLMKYQNKRGGRVVLQDIKKPAQLKGEFASVVELLSVALQLERDVNQSLLELHDLAEKNADAQFSDFIEGEFLKEQVDAIKELGDLLTRAKRCGPGLGEFLFDVEALN